nr:universal stress protein [Leisingera sp.]
MTRKILVATDGSQAAERAVNVAVGLAAGLEAELITLHVLLHWRRAEDLVHLANVEHIVDHVAGQMSLANAPRNIGQLLHETSRTGETAQVAAAIGSQIQR